MSGSRVARRAGAGTALTSVLVFGAAACAAQTPAAPTSAAGSATGSAPGSAPASTPAPSPSVPVALRNPPPEAKAAEQAYSAFISALRVSQLDPPAQVGDVLPAGGDFRRHAFDPELTRQLTRIFLLVTTHRAYRGVPPGTRVEVTGADLRAQPYPAVTLRVCTTPSPTWRQYDRRSGFVYKAATEPATSAVRMTYRKKHWGVDQIAPGAGRCG